MLRAALIFAILSGAAGCSLFEKSPAPLEPRKPRRTHSAKEVGEPYALRVNRTLIYPVQWGRAEDLAETLGPLLEHTYGPGVLVIAHPETNQLLIYLPPRDVGEGGARPRQRGAGTAPQGSAGRSAAQRSGGAGPTAR